MFDRKVWRKKYYWKHKAINLNTEPLQTPEEYKEKQRIYSLKNKERIAEWKRIYNLKNRTKIKQQKAEYRKNNIEKILLYERQYRNNKMKTDINFRLSSYLRNRVNYAIKGIAKSQRTLDLLGCSINFLKQHLESQFKPEMSWENYGKWHIDHIKPCASFDLSNESEQRKCFNFSNLQPLWAKDNLTKGSK